MTSTVKLGIIPGDGIGKEVTQEALKVLLAATRDAETIFETTEYPFGAEHYLETGHILKNIAAKCIHNKRLNL